MRHQKSVRRRSKPLASKVIYKIMPGEKLLWQKNPTDFGWDLNIVDASVQK